MREWLRIGPGGRTRLGQSRFDADLSPLAARFVLNHTIDARVNRVVAAEPDVAAGMDPRAALPHQDITGFHRLAVVYLDSATLSGTVAAVARRALSFFMRHGLSPLLGGVRPLVQIESGGNL